MASMKYHSAQFHSITNWGQDSMEAWVMGAPVDSINKARLDAIGTLKHNRKVSKVSIFRGVHGQRDSNFCGYVTRTVDGNWIYVVPKKKGEKNCRFGISGPHNSNVYQIDPKTGDIPYLLLFE